MKGGDARLGGSVGRGWDRLEARAEKRQSPARIRALGQIPVLATPAFRARHRTAGEKDQTLSRISSAHDRGRVVNTEIGLLSSRWHEAMGVGRGHKLVCAAVG